MRLTTRCPACATVFRVVPDQLKISGGWVRCGHCADVFDARPHVQAWDETTAAPVSAAQRPVEPDEDAAADLAAAPAAPAAQPRVQAQPLAALVVPAPVGAQQADAASLSIEPRLAPAPHPASDRLTPAPTPKWQPEPEAALEAEPGFVRQARQRARWRSPGARALLMALLLLLGLLLAGQSLLHQRDRLAVWQPGWEPWLNRLCAPLGCALAPVQRIDAIVIESTALLRRSNDNQYVFDLVLKNTAAIALALPALELSLTDARDTVIARRVFLPADMPDAAPLLPARGTVAISLRLTIDVGTEVPMAGYRALIFYP